MVVMVVKRDHGNKHHWGAPQSKRCPCLMTNPFFILHALKILQIKWLRNDSLLYFKGPKATAVKSRWSVVMVCACVWYKSKSTSASLKSPSNSMFRLLLCPYFTSCLSKDKLGGMDSRPLWCVGHQCWLRLPFAVLFAHVSTAYSVLWEKAGMAAGFSWAFALRGGLTHIWAGGAEPCEMSQPGPTCVFKRCPEWNIQLHLTCSTH